MNLIRKRKSVVKGRNGAMHRLKIQVNRNPNREEDRRVMVTFRVHKKNFPFILVTTIKAPGNMVSGVILRGTMLLRTTVWGTMLLRITLPGAMVVGSALQGTMVAGRMLLETMVSESMMLGIMVIGTMFLENVALTSTVATPMIEANTFGFAEMMRSINSLHKRLPC